MSRLGALIALLALHPALAGAPDGDAGTTPDAALQSEESPADLLATKDDEELHLGFTPLIWFTSFNGTSGVDGVTVDVDETFLDIVENSETVFGVMGAIDAEYKRLVFQINGVYTTATFDEHSGRARSGPLGGSGSVSVDASLEVNVTWLEAFAGYRFVDAPLWKDSMSHSRFTLDGFVGGRVTLMDLDLDVRTETSVTLPGGGELEAGRSNDLGDNQGWFEPFVGARVVFDLDEHWNITLRGDVGGFGVDHCDFSWSALAAAGYRWQMDGWTLNLFGGYRALGQDYEDDGFTWDVITHGPVIGAVFTLSF